MSRIDLREIGKSIQGAVPHEVFASFARAFLEALGLDILKGVDRGPDGGADLIAAESIVGGLAPAKRVWLVSVKHYAGSGRAVGESDEINITDRCRQHKADGFLAFYSTWPSSSLNDRLLEFGDEKPVRVFDYGRICELLAGEPRLDQVFRHYYPKSYEAVRGGYKLKLTTEVGESFPVDLRVALDLSSILRTDEVGVAHFSDRDLEDSVVAAVLMDSMIRGDFSCLKRFQSFRPLVWKALKTLVSQKGFDGDALAKEVGSSSDTAYLRLLIRLAGVARVEGACEPICEILLRTGRYHRGVVKRWSGPATPFYDVVRETLAACLPGAQVGIERHLAEAKRRVLWQEKQVLEWALGHPGFQVS